MPSPCDSVSSFFVTQKLRRGFTEKDYIQMSEFPVILFYTEKKSPRLEYILEFVFNTILGISFHITHQIDDLEYYPGPVINYSKNQIMDFLRICPHKLLFEEDITQQFVKVEKWNKLPSFFQTDEFADVPFDIFAASFFLVTRYEEYTTHSFDKFGRFRHEGSVAYVHQFLTMPVVDMWAYELKKLLLKKYPDLIFDKKEFKFIPSIDIDNAFAYLHKGFFRPLGAITKNIFTGKFSNVSNRIKVLLGKQKDPYNTYSYLIKSLTKFETKPLLFLLIGNYGKHDKNLSHKSNAFRKLIQKLSKHFIIGLHPSFASNSKKKMLAVEKKRLEDILQLKITRSRQHFLMLKIPETYLNLQKAGIKEDYSMGYAGHPGFRAGTCSQFHFFFLNENKKGNIRVTSIAIMDGSLKNYLNLSPKEAISLTKKIINKVIEVNGVFVLLWHNESVSDYQEWKGWREVFEKTIELARKN